MVAAAIAVIVLDRRTISLQVGPAPDMLCAVGMNGCETLSVEFGLDAADKIAGLADAGSLVDIEIEQHPAG